MGQVLVRTAYVTGPLDHSAGLVKCLRCRIEVGATNCARRPTPLVSKIPNFHIGKWAPRCIQDIHLYIHTIPFHVKPFAVKKIDVRRPVHKLRHFDQAYYKKLAEKGEDVAFCVRLILEGIAYTRFERRRRNLPQKARSSSVSRALLHVSQRAREYHVL